MVNEYIPPNRTVFNVNLDSANLKKECMYVKQLNNWYKKIKVTPLKGLK